MTDALVGSSTVVCSQLKEMQLEVRTGCPDFGLHTVIPSGYVFNRETQFRINGTRKEK